MTEKSGQNQAGRFQKGMSGNPSGKRGGCRKCNHAENKSPCPAPRDRAHTCSSSVGLRSLIPIRHWSPECAHSPKPLTPCRASGCGWTARHERFGRDPGGTMRVGGGAMFHRVFCPGERNMSQTECSSRPAIANSVKIERFPGSRNCRVSTSPWKRNRVGSGSAFKLCCSDAARC
jgi:hypothetical protein